MIDVSRATSIAGTVLYYQRGTEGEESPEIITGRGPTTEPLVIEVRVHSRSPIRFVSVRMLELMLEVECIINQN